MIDLSRRLINIKEDRNPSTLSCIINRVARFQIHLFVVFFLRSRKGREIKELLRVVELVLGVVLLVVDVEDALAAPPPLPLAHLPLPLLLLLSAPPTLVVLPLLSSS